MLDSINLKVEGSRPAFCHHNTDVVVQIFLWFEHFETSVILIFFCLRFISIIRDEGKQKSNWFQNF